MRLVIAAVIFGAVASQALAQARTAEDVERELKQAAEKVASTYRNGGMSDLVAVTKECYQRVAQNGFRCVYLDLGSRYIDQAASSAGMPATSYFSDQLFGARVNSVFRMTNLTSQQAADYIGNVAPIMGQLTANAYKAGAEASSAKSSDKQTGNPAADTGRPTDLNAALMHLEKSERELMARIRQQEIERAEKYRSYDVGRRQLMWSGEGHEKFPRVPPADKTGMDILTAEKLTQAENQSAGRLARYLQEIRMELRRPIDEEDDLKRRAAAKQQAANFSARLDAAAKARDDATTSLRCVALKGVKLYSEVRLTLYGQPDLTAEGRKLIYSVPLRVVAQRGEWLKLVGSEGSVEIPGTPYGHPGRPGKIKAFYYSGADVGWVPAPHFETVDNSLCNRTS